MAESARGQDEANPVSRILCPLGISHVCVARKSHLFVPVTAAAALEDLTEFFLIN